MSKDMLGVAVQKLVVLPSEALGLVCDFLEKMSDPEWVVAGKKFLRKENPWLNPWLTTCFTRNITKGWTLLEDTKESKESIVSIDKLEPVPFLKDGEAYVDGEELARRGLELHANLGQTHAEYMLEHQAEIPKEFRKYVLVFPGTKWRDRDGDRYVPYLYWDGRRWCLFFRWLGYDFDSSCRLLRSRE